MGPGSSSSSRKQGTSQLYLKVAVLGTATSWWHLRGPRRLGLPTLGEVVQSPSPISSQLPGADPQVGSEGWPPLDHTAHSCPGAARGVLRGRELSGQPLGQTGKEPLPYSHSDLTQKGLLSACSSTATSPKGQPFSGDAIMKEGHRTPKKACPMTKARTVQETE